mmetsp:Transcript_43291/g.92658  ORF Transcript_43291/g.92658 Transcript_43291/m.92658 type:complete len:539 (+) Transcript_43291:203-1819(+)|eukprot:CAMPEP_0206450918 /NCGR_PEP_ID=MMETSP0324_2-20121206/19021_1 /ASSEMBLY_ACC=CAM_ASM_000836 /TAXON_ID=2866 /ORGANISM="Crypthecodinium cohnii, Strain Seligo" /LENGTH=538 /DNA_ID=CAMNT_0053920679 /DNA_START=198 /DNA_END=1814 /DNA_ORIENTATION=+
MADSDKEEKAPEVEAAEKPEKPEKREKRLDTIPESAQSFLDRLETAMKNKNVADIHKYYEDDYNKIKEQNFKGKRWPQWESVAANVSDDPTFLCFYKELYYRHLYTDCTPNFEDRRGSWENYRELVEMVILDLEEGEMTFALPAVWILDILDEFVYHFQTFCDTRSKVVKGGHENQIAPFRDNPDIFSTQQVLMYLTRMVRLSKVEEYLQNKEHGTTLAHTDETARYFGYFAMIQLLRMHTLLADYHLAMQTIQHIDLKEEVPLFFKIPACAVSLYYYMGFCYLMMRRYADSIRTFSEILVWWSKTSGVNTKSYQYDNITKRNDRMTSLLMMALALCPRPIDESLEKTIRNEQWSEIMAKLQRGDIDCFTDQFKASCPRFVQAASPSYEKEDHQQIKEVQTRQLKLFLQEVRLQQFLPRIDSYMKLYTAIKMDKLAQLCDMEAAALRDQLMCVMHKTSQKVRNSKGAPLDGENQLCSEVEFYLDGDMVHIKAQKAEREHSAVFLEQILKFQDLLHKIENKEPVNAEAKDGKAEKATAE